MTCWECVRRRTDRSASSTKSIRSFYHSPPLILIVHNPQIPAALPSLILDSPLIAFYSCSREKVEKNLQLNNIRLWSVTFGSRRETTSRCSNRTQQTQNASSLVVIAGPRDEGLTGKALEKGALDFLPLPLTRRRLGRPMSRSSTEN